MRRKFIFIMVIVLSFLWCTACQPADVQVSTDGEWTGPVNVAEPTEEITEEDDSPSAKTYDYYISELDVTLPIPEELYVYRINGVYLDWTENINVHDFNEWILVTDVKYSEQNLAEYLRDHYAEEAKHVMFGVAITSEEMIPLERLCFGVYARGAIRVIDNGYCQVLIPTQVVQTEGWLGGYKGVDDRDTKWTEWTKEWTRIIEDNSFASVHLNITSDLTLRPVQNFVEGQNIYESTIVSDDFWELFLLAANELRTNSKTYAYDESAIKLLMEDLSERFQSFKESRIALQGESLVSVYTDAEEDIYIRAYEYARIVTQEYSELENPIEAFSLSNIVVVMQEWGDGRSSYNSFLRNESGEYQEVNGGYNYFNDLRSAYDYVQEYGNSIVIMPFTESRMGLADPRAGDTPVTMAEFCEKVIDPERCSGHFLIYMEDGVIVKIVEEFSW